MLLQLLRLGHLFFPLKKINVVTQRGFVLVDERMLPVHKGFLRCSLHIVVEQVSGKDHVLNHLSIPAACFTHPEISMVGLTEPQARERAEIEGFEISVAKTSFKANTKALAENEGEGLAKPCNLGKLTDSLLHMWFFNIVGDSRCPIADTWWQTETGGFMQWVVQALNVDIGANHSAEGVKITEEQPAFDKKQFVAFVKKYIKSLTPKLELEKQELLRRILRKQPSTFSPSSVTYNCMRERWVDGSNLPSCVYDGGRHVLGVVPKTLMPRECIGSFNIHPKKS
ncbi:hypothetical protein ACSBR1_023840 [Camellia fascicularis]